MYVVRYKNMQHYLNTAQLFWIAKHFCNFENWHLLIRKWAHKKTRVLFLFFLVKLKYWWGHWMRWGVSILYLGLHASCSILRIFSLHHWNCRQSGPFFSKKFLEFWKEGEGEHNRGFLHQNFIKNVFHNKKWEIGPDSIFETRDVGGSQILYVDLLYPEPDFQSH